MMGPRDEFLNSPLFLETLDGYAAEDLAWVIMAAAGVLALRMSTTGKPYPPSSLLHRIADSCTDHPGRFEMSWPDVVAQVREMRP
jgi:hypothetical protein